MHTQSIHDNKRHGHSSRDSKLTTSTIFLFYPVMIVGITVICFETVILTEMNAGLDKRITEAQKWRGQQIIIYIK